MGLTFAVLTLASVLQTPPPIAAPPGYTPDGSRVLLVSLPEGIAESESERVLGPGGPDLVFYFAEAGSADELLFDDPPPASIGAAPMQCPLHATLRSLGRWMLVLVSMVFVAALLGSVSATRRPLPLAAIAVRQPSRPVPLVERLLVLACLWSPMLMLLGLLQAEREMLSSVLLCMAVTGAVASAAMLASRRRLLARLRWAASAEGGGKLSTLPDGVVVKAEIDPKRLVSPPGDQGPTPWFRADLQCSAADAEPARISLDNVLVDDEAARALVRMAMGLPAPGKLTVLGCATRAPADASGAGALDRLAPTQARIGEGPCSRALLVAGTANDLARRLATESLLLAGALAGSIAAAVLTLAA